MTMADADKMLEWKNYPETRQFAILSHEEVKREDHMAWLPKYIDQFQLILNTGFGGVYPVGAVRVNGLEVSIWVDRDHRGRGIALEALKRVSFPGMIALIVMANIPSLRTFIRAGFLPRSLGGGGKFYIFEKP